MNHPNLQIAIRVALSVMAVRLVLFYGSFQNDWTEAAYLFLNLAALPAIAIYAIWPRGAYGGFLADAKICMKLLSLYGLLMTLFFFVYYSFIDTEFFASMHERITFQEMAHSQPGVDPDEMAARIRSFFSLRNGTAIALAAYMILGAFYSILFSAVKRVVPGIAGKA